MLKKRKPYVLNRNYAINDVSIDGQEIMYLGECNWDGTISEPGKKVLKGAERYLLFKFRDPKLYKTLKVSKEFKLVIRLSEIDSYIDRGNT